ncbi:uncharacterized protein [Watersipora subatra]|uniref:uncharacterized protein n=1 Tax=Watersipora subatra TaxID=2589382 RepID=UPI00355BD60F
MDLDSRHLAMSPHAMENLITATEDLIHHSSYTRKKPERYGISLRLMLARSDGDEKLFSKFDVPESNLPPISKVSIATREIRCADNCIVQEECYGFIYESSNKSCGLFGCFNREEEKYLTEEKGHEIYVMEVDHHLAQGKPVVMSSVYRSNSKPTTFYGSFAVDGIYLPPEYDKILSLAHTHLENNPWLRVNLQTIYCIWAVRILNRGDTNNESIQERLKDVIITASILEDNIFDDVTSNSFCGQYPGGRNLNSRRILSEACLTRPKGPASP